jgi:hypothetical protein
LAIPLNADLLKGFTVPQVAEKHGWTEPMVWSIALEGKSDLDRFKGLTGDCGHGTCGTGMIVINVSETIGPVEFRPK